MAKFMMLVPQKARGKYRPGLDKSPDWIVDIKYDGERRIAQCLGRQVRFSGTPSKKTGLPIEKSEQIPHLSARMDSKTLAKGEAVLYLPPKDLEGTVLDGEIISRRLDLAGGRSKYVTSIMNSAPELAVQKQVEEGWLHYVVFDCLFFEGSDIRECPLSYRRARALEAVKRWANPHVSFAKAAKSFEQALEDGEEGVIYKNLSHRYGEALGWVKRKGMWTADVVIMGFEDAQKLSKKKGEDAPTLTKYAKAGLIGAVSVGQYDDTGAMTEVATISGMTDELRTLLSERGAEYLGKVVRIKHNGREPTGRFRHPRWDDFRTDKRPQDCVMWEGET